MVLMNLPAGSNGDTDIGERLVDMGLGEGEGGDECGELSWKHINYHM